MLSRKDVVGRYLILGLELGHHVDGFVDAVLRPARARRLG